MIITPNMELSSWSSVGDYYNHTQLATNWSNIDLHDHSAGKGVKLTASLSIVAGTITTALFAAGSVTTSVIGAGAVETANIANQAVGTAQLANGAVTNAQLGTDAVESANIGTGQVETSNIANNAVELAQLAQGATPYRMKPITASENYTAVSGDYLLIGPSAVITFPPAVDSSVVGMVSPGPVSGTTPYYEFTGSLGTELFYGPGFEAGVTIGIQSGPLTALVFQAQGGNWYAIQGQYDSGWIDLSLMTLLSGVNVGPVAFTAAARVKSDQIFFRGYLVNDTGSGILDTTTVFTLPAAMRPPASTGVFPICGYGPSGGINGPAGMYIAPSGAVTFSPEASASTWVNGNAMYLDGCSAFIY